MIVRGTDKIRGVLSIQLNKSIFEIAPNKTRHLSAEDFNRQEIQEAIALGYLKNESKKTSLETPNVIGVPLTTLLDSERKIKCRNEYERPITMNMFNFPIKPGQEFALTEKELNGQDIKSAVAKGYIKILEAKTSKVSSTKTSSNEVVINISEALKQDSKSRNLRSDHQTLETNEEISTPTSVVEKGVKMVTAKTTMIDDPNPLPVKAPDTKRNTIVWNPSKNKATNTMSSNDVVFIDNKPESPDLTFVDQEQEEDRIKTHPKLKDTPLVIESDPEFVDQIQEEQRISSHPVLKSIEEEFADNESQDDR